MALSSYQVWDTFVSQYLLSLPSHPFYLYFLTISAFSSLYFVYVFVSLFLFSVSYLEFTSEDTAKDLSMCPQEPHPFRTH